MKISRKIIRAIIKEEIKRDLPLTYYSDEMLMQEGLLDWLSDLFGKFVSFFTGSAEKGTSQAQSTFSNVDDSVAKAAKEAGVEDIKTTKDLDMKDEKHQKIFYAALVPVDTEFAKGANEALTAAAAIKDWTPKSDSDEDAEAWKDENGEAAAGLWNTIGTYKGSAAWYGSKGISDSEKIAEAGDEVIKTGNPGEGVKWLATAFDSQRSLWDFATSSGVEGAGDVASMYDNLAKQTTELGKAIAASSEEQQKESIELRRLINGLIIQERARNT